MGLREELDSLMQWDDEKQDSAITPKAADSKDVPQKTAATQSAVSPAIASTAIPTPQQAPSRAIIGPDFSTPAPDTDQLLGQTDFGGGTPTQPSAITAKPEMADLLGGRVPQGPDPFSELDAYLAANKDREYDGAGFVGGVGDFMKGVMNGVVSQGPKMTGDAMQWFDPDGGIDVLENMGKALEGWGEGNAGIFEESAAGKNAEWYNPQSWGFAGGESIPISVAPVVAGMALVAGIAGAPVTAVGAAVVAAIASIPMAVLFYGSSAEENHRLAKASGFDDDDAMDIANMKGGIEAGGEVLGNALSFGILKVFTKAFGKKASKELVNGMASKATWPEVAKGMLAVVGGELVTESGQSFGQGAVDVAYGMPEYEGGPAREWQSVRDEIKEVWGPTIITSMFLGGGGIALEQKQKANIMKALNNPAKHPESAAKAVNFVYQGVRREDAELAELFLADASKQLAAGKPVILKTDMEYFLPKDQDLSGQANPSTVTEELDIPVPDGQFGDVIPEQAIPTEVSQRAEQTAPGDGGVPTDGQFGDVIGGPPVQETQPEEIQPIDPNSDEEISIEIARARELALQSPEGANRSMLEGHANDLERELQRRVKAREQINKANVDAQGHLATEEQKSTGEYKKGRADVGGLTVNVENGAGTVRSGIDENGEAWNIRLPYAYGSLHGTVARDGDELDVFLGPKAERMDIPVHIIDQVDADGRFDEHKVMLGFGSMEEAKQAYVDSFNQGESMGHTIHEMTRDEFLKWAFDPPAVAQPINGKIETAIPVETKPLVEEAVPVPEEAVVEELTDEEVDIRPETPAEAPTGHTGGGAIPTPPREPNSEEVVADGWKQTSIDGAITPSWAKKGEHGNGKYEVTKTGENLYEVFDDGMSLDRTFPSFGEASAFFDTYRGLTNPDETGVAAEVITEPAVPAEQETAVAEEGQTSSNEAVDTAISSLPKVRGWSREAFKVNVQGWSKYVVVRDTRGRDGKASLKLVKDDGSVVDMPRGMADRFSQAVADGETVPYAIANTEAVVPAEEVGTEEPVVAKTIEEEFAEADTDDILGMFDETASVPPAPVEKPTSTGGGGRVTKKGDEIKQKARESKSAADAIAKAAEQGVVGIDEITKGLVKLFGGGTNTAASFPGGLNRDAYNEAKKHFDAGFAAFGKAGKSLKEFVSWVKESFGESARGYLAAWIDDKKGVDIEDRFETAEVEETEVEPTDEVEVPEESEVEVEVEVEAVVEEDVEYEFPDAEVERLYSLVKQNGDVSGKDLSATYKGAGSATARAELQTRLHKEMTGAEKVFAPGSVPNSQLIQTIKTWLRDNTDVLKDWDDGVTTIKKTEGGDKLSQQGTKAEDTKELGIAGLKKDMMEYVLKRQSQQKDPWQQAISKLSKASQWPVVYDTSMTPGAFRFLTEIRDNLQSANDFIRDFLGLRTYQTYRDSKAVAVHVLIQRGIDRRAEADAEGEGSTQGHSAEEVVEALTAYAEMLETLRVATVGAKTVEDVRNAIVGLLVKQEFIDYIRVGGDAAAAENPDIEKLEEADYRHTKVEDGSMSFTHLWGLSQTGGRADINRIWSSVMARRLWDKADAYIDAQNDAYAGTGNATDDRLNIPVNQIIRRGEQFIAIPENLKTKELAEWMDAYIRNTFGVRATATGNWVTSAHQRILFFLTANSFHDLAKLIGAPLNGIGLGPSVGKAKLGDESVATQSGLTMAIAFGAMGVPGSAATWWADYLAINLNRDNGAGSVSHEWGHAFDHMGDWSLANNTNEAYHVVDAMADMKEALQNKYDAENAISHVKAILAATHKDNFRETPLEEAKKFLAETWEEYIKTETEFYRLSRREGEYWGRPKELFARMFETFVADNMDDLNQFLVDPAKTLMGPSRHVYPQGKERLYLDEIFQRFLDGIVWGADGKPRMKEDFVPIVAQIRNDAKAALDEAFADIDAMYQAMHQGEPSADGLYWYGHKVSTPSEFTNPRGNWGVDLEYQLTKEQGNNGGRGAVGYPSPLHADDVLRYRLKPVTHDENANKLYIEEEKRGQQSSTPTSSEGSSALDGTQTGNGGSTGGGGGLGGVGGDGSGDGGGGYGVNDEGGSQPGGRKGESDDGLDSPAVGDDAPDNQPREDAPAPDYELTYEDSVAPKDISSRFSENIGALKVLKMLEVSGRPATLEQQQVLAKYSGWAGMGDLFQHYVNNQPWAGRKAMLLDILTEQEFRDAKNAARDENFVPTPLEALWSVWDAAIHFGFGGGTVYVPGFGTGNIFGTMPTRLRGQSQVSGVERDPVAAKIAKKLYGSVAVDHADMKDTAAPDNYYDLVVLSGDETSAGRDGLHNPAQHKVGPYFIRRAMKMTRPGGIVAAVIPSSITDGYHHSEARAYAAMGLELVGGVRTPSALSEFTSEHRKGGSYDILFFRKEDLDNPLEGEPHLWGKTSEWKGGVLTENGFKEGASGVFVNEYFAKNPDMVIGTPIDLNGQVGSVLDAEPGVIREKITEVIQAKLPSGIFTKEQTGADKPLHELLTPPGQQKEGGFHIDAKGSLTSFSQGTFSPVDEGKDIKPEKEKDPKVATSMKRNKTILEKRGKIIREFVGLRDKIRQLLLMEALEEAGRDKVRKELRSLYDKFLKGNGHINDPSNMKPFIADPDAGLVMALEKWDYVNEEPKGLWEIFTEDVLHGTKPMSPAMMSEMAVSQDKPISQVAYEQSVNWKGRVDWAWMSEMTGQSEAELQKALNGIHVFLDPLKGWQPASLYLSGDVRSKLELAQNMAKQAPEKFAKNVEALEAVQLRPLTEEEVLSEVISDRLLNPGSPWMPPDVLRSFVNNLFRVNGFSVEWVPEIGKWKPFFSDDNAKRAAGRRAQHSQYSTTRHNFFSGVGSTGPGLFEIALNGGASTRGTKGEQQAANRAIRLIRDQFNEYLKDNPRHLSSVLEAFNKEHRRYHVTEFDGAQLTMPGKVVNQIVDLYQHQKNAIAQSLWQNIYFGHEVGVGKTYTMIGSIMEARRLGRAKRPVFGMLKANLDAIYTDFLHLYPGANIMRIESVPTDNAKRQELLKKITGGNWDAVLVTHEALDMLRVSPEQRANVVREELEGLQYAANSKYRWTQPILTELEGEIKALEGQLTALAAETASNAQVRAEGGINQTFEELGIDMLVLDEAHYFKNLQYRSAYAKQGISFRGIGGEGSSRAANLLDITTYLNRRGKRIIMASGTPVSNSAAELFAIARYLQPEVLKARGIETFDAWLHSFGQVDVDWAPKITGDGYEQVGKFRDFYFVGDLLRMSFQTLDVRKAADIGIRRPKIRKNSSGENAPEAVMVEQAPILQRFMSWLRFRAYRLKNGGDNDRVEQGRYLIGMFKDLMKKVKPGEKEPQFEAKSDIVFSIVNDGRQAAINMKLVDPRFVSDGKTKVDAVVDRVIRHYHESTDIKGTQLIFADFGTPTPQNKLRGYNVYDDIKAQLIKQGVPEKEIAFITDVEGSGADAKTKKKRILFDKVNKGSVRILIGSTKKLGTGVNVQQRVVALHHLDVDWNFSSYEQRNGRGIRQGNLMEYWRIKEDGSWFAPTWDEIDAMSPTQIKEARDKALGVAIFNYGTLNTVDQYMWSTVARKGRFIDQIMSKRLDLIVLEDLSDDTATANNMMASLSGDPLEKERVELDERIIALRQERQVFESAQAKARTGVVTIPSQITALEGDNVEYQRQNDILEKATTAKLQKTDKMFEAEKKAHAEEVKKKGADKAGPEPTQVEYLDLKKDGPRIKEILDARLLEPVVKERLLRDIHNLQALGVVGFLTKDGVFEKLDVGINVSRTESGLYVLLKGLKDKEFLAGLGFSLRVANRAGNNTAYSSGLSRSISTTMAANARLTKKNEEKAEELLAELDRLKAFTVREFAGAVELKTAQDRREVVMNELRSRPPENLSDTDEFSYVKSYHPEGSWSDVEKAGTGGSFTVRADGGAAFNLGAKEIVGSTVGSIRESIERVTKLWKGSPPVIVLQSQDHLPNYIKDQLKKGAKGAIKGAFDSHTGTVYLIADNLTGPVDAQRVLFHETVGHFGLRKVLGADIYPVLNQIYIAFKKQADAIALQYGIDTKTQDGRKAAAEELLANMAELNQNPGIVQRAIAAIRAFLRKFMPRLVGAYTENDLRVLVATAGKAVRTGGFPAGPGGGGDAAFKRGNTNLGSEAQQAAREATMGKSRASMTLTEKVKEAFNKATDMNWAKIRQAWVDDQHILSVYERHVHGTLQDAALSATKMAKLTRNLDSVMAAVMLKGSLVYRDGAFQLKDQTNGKGFTAIFEPLVNFKNPKTGKTEDVLELWEGWAAATRAKELFAQGREKNFTLDQIDALLDVPQEYQEMFQSVFEDYQTFNHEILNLATDTGLLNATERAQWETRFYLPFYRVMEETLATSGGQSGPKGKTGLEGQSAGIRRLKGGEGKIGPVIENMFLNAAHIIDASMKNVAMQRIVKLTEGEGMENISKVWKPVMVPNQQILKALKAAGVLPDEFTLNELEAMMHEGSSQSVSDKVSRETLEALPHGNVPQGFSEEWSKVLTRVAPQGADVVSVMVDGKPQYYRITDPLLLRSVVSMRPQNADALMTAMRLSKKVLTKAVTVDPAFMVANFIRDSFSTWLITDTKMIPIFDSAKGAAAAIKDDQRLLSIMAAGGGLGGYYDTRPTSIRKHLQRELGATKDKSFQATVVDTPAKAWNLWQKVGAASESANRLVVFSDVTSRKQGSVAEGAFQAMDVLNFTQRGDYAAVRFLTETVPFLNARLQGLDRLGRGMMENPIMFAKKGAMLVGATLVLAAANAGNDDYDDLPEWDKDTYWHIFFGKEHIRLPKPFEVGAIFGTMPERFYEAIRKERGDLFAQSFVKMFAETFAFNPVPQLFKPIFEQSVNKNFFTGSPIIGGNLEGKLPEAQYEPWTSETTRFAGETIPGISPKRFEELIRGYTGSLGMYVLGISDWAMRTSGYYPEAPSMTANDIPVLSRFYRDDVMRNTKHYESFYEMVTEAGKLYSTIKQYRLEGRPEDAAKLIEDNRDKLKARLPLNRIRRRLSQISNKEKLIQKSNSFSPEAKRAKLDALQVQKNILVKRAAEFEERFR